MSTSSLVPVPPPPHPSAAVAAAACHPHQLKRRSKSLGDLTNKRRAAANVKPLRLECNDDLHHYNDASTPTTPVVSFSFSRDPTASWGSPSPHRPAPRRRHSSSCESSNKECVRLATIYGWRLTTSATAAMTLPNCGHAISRQRLSRDVHADASMPPLQALAATTAPDSETALSGSSSRPKRPSQPSLPWFPPPAPPPPCSSSSPFDTPTVGKLSKMFSRRQTLTPASSFSRMSIRRRSSGTSSPRQPRDTYDQHSSSCRRHHHRHDDKTKGIVSAIIAVANRPDSEQATLGWVGVEDAARESACSDPDNDMAAMQHQRPPTPPIENDPHVFDLLATNSGRFIMFRRRDECEQVMTSATAEKLVEKLTCEMDSEYLMDFFLTYRQFLTHIKLCKLLILRFRWALLQDTDDRLLVRIRTFVVIRYWMIHYWAHDFAASRTLRFMLSTFLSQLRTHPTILASPRDARIIHSLRSLFKRQRKLHNNAKSGDISVRSSMSHLDTLTTRSSSAGGAGVTCFSTHRSDISYHSKDSAIGSIATHLHPLKPSISTPSLPFLTRARRLSATSHRSVNSSNAWTAKMNFSLKAIKRSVPTMYNSIRHGFHHSHENQELADCLCGGWEDQRRVSLCWSTASSNNAKSGASGDSDKHHHHLRASQPNTPAVRNSVHPAGCPLHDSLPPPPTTPSPSPLHRRLSRQPCSANLYAAAEYQPFVLRYRSEIIAQQFCCIEQQMLQNVTWHELIELKWRKNQQLHQRSSFLQDESELWRRQQQGCGVEQLISYFNMTCQWITSEIVQTRSLDTRVLVIEKYIRIALKCFHHRNYSTLMQILLGLQSPAVSRLERTWQRIDQYEMQVFGELKELAKPFRNWKSVRHAMSQAIQEMDESSAVESVLTRSRSTNTSTTTAATPTTVDRGCIPFLGLYLSDLVFNAELPNFISLSSATSSDTDNDDDDDDSEDDDSFLRSRLTTQLVNYNKFRIMASIVKHVLTYQVLSRAYRFQHHPELCTRLQNLRFLDNAEIRTASLLCEN